MQFIYHKNCGDKSIILDKNAMHHIFNVRREKHNIGDVLRFANLVDSRIYYYKIVNKGKKETLLEYVDSSIIKHKSPKTHIIQAIVDMNEFSKILPSLNELFVQKITFFYSDFSQKNQKVNMDRLIKIIINSCEQCGRMDLMDIEILPNLDMVLENYKNAIALDFNGENSNLTLFDSFIIGAEGGFSQREKILLANKTFSIDYPLVLRSITASLFIASNKILRCSNNQDSKNSTIF
ncbi:hypothetical protein CCY99_02700 [Helicobacter sp. 16-1353]|uniref:16S rRNA (uracil(1498)-N(3))-methyltransferase n=1 Tax=Helicobacter sp. 16-1353 TaxID=2004996 RepID=UPI000DCDF091|nr:RsmE family RNA methyltransferase [Helicobacter sp. 16-1353]RAX54689.1 hypothetical protein CCY99_02700 [Helicobacter sp. 16-1353]